MYICIMLITMFLLNSFIIKIHYSGLIYITFICIIKNLELSLGCVFISNVVFIHFIKVKKVRCKTKVLERKVWGIEVHNE